MGEVAGPQRALLRGRVDRPAAWGRKSLEGNWRSGWASAVTGIPSGIGLPR